MGGLVDGSSGSREPRAAERGLQTGSAGLARGEPVRNGGPGPSWARRAGTRLLTKCPGGACGQPSVSTRGTAPEPWRRLSRRSLSDGPSQEGGAGSPRPPQAKSGTSQLALADGNTEGPKAQLAGGGFGFSPHGAGGAAAAGGAWSPGAVHESTAPRGRPGGRLLTAPPSGSSQARVWPTRGSPFGVPPGPKPQIRTTRVSRRFRDTRRLHSGPDGWPTAGGSQRTASPPPTGPLPSATPRSASGLNDLVNFGAPGPVRKPGRDLKHTAVNKTCRNKAFRFD